MHIEINGETYFVNFDEESCEVVTPTGKHIPVAGDLGPFDEVRFVIPPRKNIVH